MKKGLFGKLLFLALAVIALFALSSCGKNKGVEYDITGKSDFSVADTTFDEDVVITGEGGISDKLGGLNYTRRRNSIGIDGFCCGVPHHLQYIPHQHICKYSKIRPTKDHWHDFKTN